MSGEKVGTPLERRIRELESEILRWIDDVWTFSWRDSSTLPPGVPNDTNNPAHPVHAAERESLRRLLARWTPEELSARAADMHFHHGLWYDKHKGGNWRDWDRRDTIERLVRLIVKTYPPADLPQRLGAELERSLDSGIQRQRIEEVLELPDTPASHEVVRKIVRGAFPIAPDHLAHHGRILERLHLHGELTYEVFRDFARRVPRMLFGANRGYEPGNPKLEPPYDPGFLATCRAYVERLADECLAGFDPADPERLGLLTSIGEFRGPRYLVAAARLHRDLGLGIVSRAEFGHERDVVRLLNDLARAREVEPEAGPARVELVKELQGFPAETLRRLLPLADRGRTILLEALGWQRAIRLVWEVERLGGAFEDRDRITGFRGSADPTFGVLDLPSVRAALDDAGEEIARDVFRLFREAKRFHDTSVVLLEAVPGWNRNEVAKRVQRRNQVSVKAYGLLPIQRGDAEVQERYLFLRQFAKESRRFGPMRQVNERAAAEVGLANLAHVAGYADAMRLEWAMEARIGGEGGAAQRTWTVGEYSLCVEGRASEARLAVSKGAKRLASVPPAVRKDSAYKEAKEAVAAIRGQVSRFRAAFEDMMVAGDVVVREDLERLARLPVARDLLRCIVVAGEDGARGILDPEGTELVGLDETRVHLPARVIIEHPYHLFRAGVLGRWQQELVRRRIVQPFKQVFREVYVVTLAERTTRTFSNRFAGRIVNPRIAQKLFQSRAWQVETGDVAVPYKLFPSSGLRVEFVFPNAGHYLGETNVSTTDQVYFLRHPPPPGSPADFEARKVPLEEVPPIVFSEVMRDADLIVSVAPGTDEGGVTLDLSEEAYQRRGDVVKAILADLGLRNVVIEGRFARIEGKLAKYRVHLGSANVYVDPGNHVCIIPDRYRKPPAKLFLPFSADEDPIVAEVVSKVVLLANDDKIRDESILRQITDGGHPAHGDEGVPRDS